MRNQDSVMSVILLDAMGVIYQSGDDVGELLIPFIRDKGSKVEVDVIENAYKRASLGLITANQFWEEVDISSEFENEYLSLHKLSNGVLMILYKKLLEKIYVALVYRMMFLNGQKNLEANLNLNLLLKTGSLAAILG